MAGQPHSRGALSRELSGIPVTKTHQLASYVSEMQTPSLCRAGTGTEVIQYCIPQLPRAWTQGPCSCWQSAIGRIPWHPASCQRGHPKLPPVWHSARGHLNSPPSNAWHVVTGHLSPSARGTVPGGSEHGTLSLQVDPCQV